MASLPYLCTASAASLQSACQGGKLTSQSNASACSIKSLPASSLSGHSMILCPNFPIKCACSAPTLLPCIDTPSMSIASNTPSVTITTSLLLSANLSTLNTYPVCMLCKYFAVCFEGGFICLAVQPTSSPLYEKGTTNLCLYKLSSKYSSGYRPSNPLSYAYCFTA